MGRWGKLSVGAMFLLLVAGLIALIHYFLSTPETSKKRLVQQISLIKPPPPKMEQKPPPPKQEIKKEEVKLDEPPPLPQQQDEPPPSPDLGVDANATPGSDSFGLVGRPGGHNLIGGNGSRFGWYGKLIQQDVEDALKQDKKRLSAKQYQVVVRLWLTSSGGVDRFELATTTGSPDLDNAIKQALNEIKSVKEAPPEDMPQPVLLRISSR